MGSIDNSAVRSVMMSQEVHKPLFLGLNSASAAASHQL